MYNYLYNINLKIVLKFSYLKTFDKYIDLYINYTFLKIFYFYV